MMKNLKLILLLFTGLFGSQLFGMHAMGSNSKKRAVAAAAMLTGVTAGIGCAQQFQEKKRYERQIKDASHPLDDKVAHDVRQSLISHASATVDRDKLGKIEFRTIDAPALPFGAKIDGKWTIFSGPRQRKWSDFSYLREVDRLNNKDFEYKELRRFRDENILRFGLFYYFCKNPSLKRFAALIPLCYVADKARIWVDSLAQYRTEQRADKFAIQALRSKGDVNGLAAGSFDLMLNLLETDSETDTVLFELEEKYPFLMAASAGRRSQIRRSINLLTEAQVLEEELHSGEHQPSKSTDGVDV